MSKIWERQDNETVKAYEAFDTYLRMDGRSIRDVAQRLNKSDTLIARWSVKNNWVERVQAYEDHLATLRRDQYESKRLEARQSRQQLIDAMQSLIARVYRRLDSQEREGKALMSPQDLSALTSAVSRILQESRNEYNDLATQRHEIKDWRSEAIDAIKAGDIDYHVLREEIGETLADELFRSAGVVVSSQD